MEFRKLIYRRGKKREKLCKVIFHNVLKNNVILLYQNNVRQLKYLLFIKLYIFIESSPYHLTIQVLALGRNLLEH